MAFHQKSLEDQVIVLTGASSGIGLVTARMAARRGAKLVLAARNQDALRELAAEINTSGGQAVDVVADVGRLEDVERIAQTAIDRFGGFDTWVNDAGVSLFGKLVDTSIPDMHRLFETNFWGAVYGSLAAVRHLRSRGGTLINVGSVFSDRATPVQSIYSASKHAMKGFTDALRMELEADDLPIQVTLVKPGRIDTPYGEHARSYQAEQPSHRGMVYPPESVAEAILYCAEHRRRDMYVGSQARLAAMLGAVAPRLTDIIMEKTQFKAHKSDRPSRGPDDNALYHAGYGMHERGEHLGWMRTTSLYTKATTHPAWAGLALAGLVVGAAALGRRRS